MAKRNQAKAFEWIGIDEIPIGQLPAGHMQEIADETPRPIAFRADTFIHGKRVKLYGIYDAHGHMVCVDTVPLAFPDWDEAPCLTGTDGDRDDFTSEEYMTEALKVHGRRLALRITP